MRPSTSRPLVLALAVAALLLATAIGPLGGLLAGLTGYAMPLDPQQRGGQSPCWCEVARQVAPDTPRLCDSSAVTVTLRPACPGLPIHIVLIIDEVYKPNYSEPGDRARELRKAVGRLEMKRHPNIKVGVVWMQNGRARERVELTTDEQLVLRNLDVPPVSRFGAQVQCFECGYREAVAMLSDAAKEYPRNNDIVEITILAPLGVYTNEAVPGVISGSRLVKTRGATSITTCFAWTHCHSVLRDAASKPNLYLGFGEGNRLAAILEGEVRSAVATFLRTMTVHDVLPDGLTVDEDTIQPPPAVVGSAGRTVRWEFQDPETKVYTFTYRVRPGRLGTLNLGVGAWVSLQDSQYRVISTTLPTQAITVSLLCPQATPTPEPTVTDVPTATPTRTTTPTSTPTTTPSPAPTPTPVVSPVYLPITLREECRPLHTHTDVVLVLDVSTSMGFATADGQRKLDAALAGARRFVAAMALVPDEHGRSDRVAIVGFNHHAWIQQPLTNDAAALNEAIAALPLGMEEFTRLDLAFTRGAEALAAPRDPDTSAAMVLLTDGLPNRVPLAPDGSQETTVLRAAQAAKDVGITIYTIGVGRADGPLPEISAALLTAAASRPEYFLTTTEAGQLDAIYGQLTRIIPCGRSVFWTGRP